MSDKIGQITALIKEFEAVLNDQQGVEGSNFLKKLHSLKDVFPEELQRVITELYEKLDGKGGIDSYFKALGGENVESESPPEPENREGETDTVNRIMDRLRAVLDDSSDSETKDGEPSQEGGGIESKIGTVLKKLLMNESSTEQNNGE